MRLHTLPVHAGEIHLERRLRRKARRRQAEKAHSAAAQRMLIVHYHLFKNAGTSVDDMLRQNFGRQWAEQEFPGSGARRSNVAAVTDYLREHPALVALSSHTALLPAPELDDAIVFPIVFVRHPIDRLHSAYRFERMQNADTPGARLAKEHDFAGYLRELLKQQRKRQARSFQTYRLAMNEPRETGTEIERAMRAIDRLPFIGLVEEFDRSIQRLEELVKPLLPSFRAIEAHRNATEWSPLSLESKLIKIEMDLGRTLFEELQDANAHDLEVYRVIRSRYACA